MPPTLYRWSELPEEQVTDLLSRKLITGERLMVTHVYLKEGCVVPMHSHENEQISYMLAGSMRFSVGEDGREFEVRAGEVIHLPPNVPHSAVALEDSISLDIFDPPRQDWLDGTDDYLRR